MVGYYDYVLGFIPVALIGITSVLTLFGWSVTQAIPIGAGIATIAVGHALFINGPQGIETDTTHEHTIQQSNNYNVEDTTPKQSNAAD